MHQSDLSLSENIIFSPEAAPDSVHCTGSLRGLSLTPWDQRTACPSRVHAHIQGKLHWCHPPSAMDGVCVLRAGTLLLPVVRQEERHAGTLYRISDLAWDTEDTTSWYPCTAQSTGLATATSDPTGQTMLPCPSLRHQLPFSTHWGHENHLVTGEGLNV